MLEQKISDFTAVYTNPDRASLARFPLSVPEDIRTGYNITGLLQFVDGLYTIDQPLKKITKSLQIESQEGILEERKMSKNSGFAEKILY
ncbi:MAG: hypothetical protein K2O18_00530 [Oscillospiraceae bacterium]|nr:hypothetical protein [Oscillospiraceae bacterium]